jgi:uncharacterized protein YndB with AHSA1/START domain
MIKTKANVEIRRPVSEVFAFVTRVDNFPRWFGDIVATSRQTSPGAVGVGTTFAQTHHFLGQRFESRFVVTAYEPDRLFCVGTSAGPVPFQGCFTFEAVEEGTRCTDQHAINPQGFFGLIGSLLVGRLRQQAETNLANLKRLLEADPVAAAGDEALMERSVPGD